MKINRGQGSVYQGGRIMRTSKTLVIKSKSRFIIFVTILIVLAAACLNFAFNAKIVKAENHPSYVTVQVSDGDTLWSIADKYMNDTKDQREAVYDIQKANDMSQSDTLQAGTTIKVPVSE